MVDDLVRPVSDMAPCEKARSGYAHSLMRRIEAYFVANPHEYLTWEDMTAKFNCSVPQARRAVENLREYSAVELEKATVIRVRMELS